MKNKKLLAIILLSLSFCFVVSGVGCGEINEELIDIKVSRMEYLLLKAQVEYMIYNPTNFLNVRFVYDQWGWRGLALDNWPVKINTEKTVVIDIRDSRNIFLNKSGVALLEMFKKELDVIYSFIRDIATFMRNDIVAKFYSQGGIPLGYFYEGEYYLWKE